MLELRKTEREPSFLRGRVILDDERTSIDCIIRDLTESGARVIFASNVTVPETVTLSIPAKDKVHQARVTWRNNFAIGLEFPGATQPQSAGNRDLNERLARLEEEIATLRRLVMTTRNRTRAG